MSLCFCLQLTTLFTFQFLVRLYIRDNMLMNSDFKRFTFQFLVRLYILDGVSLYFEEIPDLHSNFWLDYISKMKMAIELCQHYLHSNFWLDYISHHPSDH